MPLEINANSRVYIPQLEKYSNVAKILEDNFEVKEVDGKWILELSGRYELTPDNFKYTDFAPSSEWGM